MERLILHCKKLLEDVSICKVPVISSPEEEQLLLSSSAKVCRLEDSIFISTTNYSRTSLIRLRTLKICLPYPSNFN